jgi:alpha-1,2-mannosyltransferase
MTVGLTRIGGIAATAAVAWWISGRMDRNRPISGWRQFLSGPLGILAIGLGISLVVGVAVSGSGETTVLSYAQNAFAGGGIDSWFFMDLAARRLHDAPHQPLYQEIFFHQAWKFQYPITCLLGWNALKAGFGGSLDATAHFLNAICFHWLAVSGLLSALLLRGSWTRVHGKPPSETRFGTFLFLVGGILQAFLFYPLTRSWWLGQIQTTLSMLAIGALLAWQNDRKKTAGILVGLACLCKPQWGVALLWGMVFREWRFALSGLLVCAIGGIAAGTAFGFNQYLDYLPVLSTLSHHGESTMENESMNGLMIRLLHGGALEFDPHSFPPYIPIVYWTTLLTGLLMIGTVFLWGWRRVRSETELAMVLLVLTIASPIAWEHHYGVLPGILAVWVPCILLARPVGCATPFLVALLWIFVDQNFPWLLRFAESRSTSVLLSHLYFGALGFMGLALAIPAAMSRSWPKNLRR